MSGNGGRCREDGLVNLLEKRRVALSSWRAWRALKKAQGLGQHWRLVALWSRCLGFLDEAGASYLTKPLAVGVNCANWWKQNSMILKQWVAPIAATEVDKPEEGAGAECSQLKCVARSQEDTPCPPPTLIL